MISFKDFILLEISDKVLDQTVVRMRKQYDAHSNDLSTQQRDELIISYVHRFNNLVVANKIKSVDIQKISFEDLKDIVDEKENTLTKTQEKKQKKDVIKQEGVEKTFENDKAVVYWIKTKAASCIYGKGTKWCISGEKNNPWNEEYYAPMHNIFFIMPKMGKKKYAILVNKIGDVTSTWDEMDDGMTNGEMIDMLNSLNLPTPKTKHEFKKIFPAKKIESKKPKKAKIVITDNQWDWFVEQRKNVLEKIVDKVVDVFWVADAKEPHWRTIVDGKEVWLENEWVKDI